MSAHQYRAARVTGLANGAELRRARFDGADQIVVPVVALVGDAVVRPLGSSGPEFVPASALAVAPGGWDGRPALPDHPKNGRANEPATLEAARIGYIFNSRFDDRRLKVEAWIDEARAKKLGGDAKRVLDRCLAGEMVEVSVGCWVTVEQRSGISPSGVPYEYVWHDVVPDHLAMLPEGTEGACSIDMGCGAPRAAKRQEEPEPMADKEQDKAPQRGIGGFLAKTLGALREQLGFRAAEPEGVSDVDLREALWNAIRAVEPGFDWIVEVFPESSTVVYTTAPEDAVLWWSRTYAVSESGEVTLTDDRDQVEPVTRYEPVTAAAEPDPEPEPQKQPAVARAACGCQKTGEGHAAPAQTQEGDRMNAKDLVGRLIACERSPFTDKDKTLLEAFGAERLAEMVESFEAEPEDVEPKKEPPKAAEPEEPTDTVRLSRDEYQEIRAAADAHKVAQATRKTALLVSLKDKQDTYTEDELKAMQVTDLEKLAKLLKVGEPVPDYSGRALPVNAADASQFEPPNPYAPKPKEAN